MVAAVADRPVLVVGGGGHARVLIDALRRAGRQIIGVLDPDPAVARGLPEGVAQLGGDEKLAAFDQTEVALVNGLGSIRLPTARASLFDRLQAAGWRFASVLHDSAVLALDTRLGEGAQVMAGAVLQTGVTLDDDVIVNTRASLDHDCRIGRHCHVAPGATLSGGVAVGAGTHIGTGASIIQGVRIGAGCLIGAGSVVTRDLPDGAVLRHSSSQGTRQS